MSKIIGLVDCDCFFASCEKVFRPDWRDKPLVVLSNNDGCVVARSPEAKALQIPMGEPYFKLEPFARARGVVTRSANYTLYGDMSRRVMSSLETWSPYVEIYSIDEAFLDLTERFTQTNGLFVGEDEDPPTGKSLGDVPRKTRVELEKLAEEIVTKIRKWTGIPVSLGLAPTRTLAKAASRIAKDECARTGKKYALLFTREERAAALRRLPVEKVWGVGRGLLRSLNASGVRTAFDLAKLDPRFMRDAFSIVQERLVRELRGELMYDRQLPESQKSLQVSRSFGETLDSLEELEKPVATFATKVAAKLRARRLVASGLHVYIATNRFNANEPQHSAGAACTFSKPTNATPEILKVALKLLRGIRAEGYAYKRAGVLALELLDESVANARGYLFEPDPSRPQETRERDQRLCVALDKINARMGKNSLFFAAEGVDRAWTPNSQFISPNYTTDWDALPVAR